MLNKQNKAPFLIAHVAPAVPLRKTLHYKIPQPLYDTVKVGSMVAVPLGNRRVTGYVITVVEASSIDGLKAIEKVLDSVPVFSATDLEFLQWAAKYYCCPLGEVLKNALPAGIKEETVNHVCITSEGEQALNADGLDSKSRELLQQVAEKKEVALTRLKRVWNRTFPGKYSMGCWKKHI